MHVAVISDVHANLHALEAVLADIDRERVDAVWSLGDVVGYGPQPSRCCELVAAHADVSLCGNHDLGALLAIDLDDFSPDAAAAARWTSSELSEDDREYLKSLEPHAETPRATLVHGSPRDPVWEYVLTPDAVLAAIEEAARPLLLVGHSHVALALELTEELAGGLAPDGTQVCLDEKARRLLNPGSVGQPRDGDPRAAWLLLDFDRLLATFRRVDYPIDRTQAEIRAAGLPAILATRLASGT
jgi:diadenosine tetraphosphatase ApaH/serine/threonine PP2A family protein phosphatase